MQWVYQAKEVGFEIVWEKPTKSYNLVPKYYHVLTKVNNGTIIHLELDGALRTFIEGFIQYIRLIIVVDNSHLKGLYGRTMFVATCLDGNNQLYSLAIKLLDTENNDTWK